jgi:arginyl-tRNA synthetase
VHVFRAPRKVDLPSGKMKSREGTVVDADDLMQKMTGTAQKNSEI